MSDMTPEDYANLDYEAFKDINEGPARPISYIFKTAKAILEYPNNQSFAEALGVAYTTVADITRGATASPHERTLLSLVNLARDHGYYLSYEKVYRSAGLGNIGDTFSRDPFLDDFERRYLSLNEDLRVAVRYAIEAILSIANRKQ